MSKVILLFSRLSRLSLLLLALSTLCRAAELPPTPAPQSASAAQSEQAIESPGQNIVKGPDGKFHIARWTVGLFLEHDVKGWGPSSRVDYRINNRYGLVGTEVKKTISGGVTIRLGSLN